MSASERAISDVLEHEEKFTAKIDGLCAAGLRVTDLDDLQPIDRHLLRAGQSKRELPSVT